jgi:hypothetical protein
LLSIKKKNDINNKKLNKIAAIAEHRAGRVTYLKENGGCSDDYSVDRDILTAPQLLGVEHRSLGTPHAAARGGLEPYPATC